MECFVSILSSLHSVLLFVGKSDKYYTKELHAGTLKARNFGCWLQMQNMIELTTEN